MMFIDLHVHTRHYSGCSHIEARDLIVRARQEGIDGIVLTEHGILWKEELLTPLREEAESQGRLILAGQEVTCFHRGRRQGDFLVFGASRSLGSDWSARELIQRVHDEGGVVVAAHPYKPSRLDGSYYGIGDEIYHLELDGVELYHPEQDEEARLKVRAAAKELGVPMTGGSDAHELYQLGPYGTRFFNRVANIEELVAEIRAGRVHAITRVQRL